MNIREAKPADGAELAEIYRPYVEQTAITFEYDPPTGEEMTGRICRTLEKYPYLVAEEDGKILGYAYAGAFYPRAAYQHGAELSVYIREEYRGKGLGQELYSELERRLIRQNVHVLYACVATTDRKDDPHLTDGSVRFHEREGFRTVGRFGQCGFKFGRWYDMIWMEKRLREAMPDPAPFIPRKENAGGDGKAGAV